MRFLVNVKLSIWITALAWMSPSLAKNLERSSHPELALPLLPQIYHYHSDDAFPGLRFSRPVQITSPPNEKNRLFVVEQGGKIWVIPDLKVDTPEPRLFLDLSDRTIAEEESGLLSLAFHPKYATNGRFFVFYTLMDQSSLGEGLHDRLSEFRISTVDPNRADETSEKVLINQYDRSIWHNAGAMDFGPDGYLYLSVGDEGDGADNLHNSQRIDHHFYSGILRLDIDGKVGNSPPNPHPAAVGNYSIPADNPYIGLNQFNGKSINPNAIRTEFYAIGLRNAWRFSFDPATGRLFCNDTGDFTREEINLIEKGGNYGWAVYEGSHYGPKWSQLHSTTKYLPPIAEYGREQGNDIAAGLCYRGKTVSSLDGSYIFSDFWNGFIGRISMDPEEDQNIEWLTWDAGISDISIRPDNGEILMADWFDGTIRRLNEGPQPDLPALPQRLSETGLFQDLKTLTPSEGLIPYDINVTFWSDNAIKQRWFSLPQKSQHFVLKNNHQLSYPAGAIWVKQFDLELEPGNPSSLQRLETRILVQTQFGFPYGFTYRWGDSTSDAYLVGPEGKNETFLIKDSDGDREQVWRYPSRRECVSCHRSNNSGALGFTIPQLNTVHPTQSGWISQLETLSDAGYFNPPLKDVHTMPALSKLDDETASLDERVRSYLYANCSSCHQAGKMIIADWDARRVGPLMKTGLVDIKPRRPFGLPFERLIKPGSLESSVLFHRVSQNQIGRMPPISSQLLDQQGIDLLRRWITQSLPGRSFYDEWKSENLEGLKPEWTRPQSDPDADGASNYFEFLTGSNPTSTHDAFQMQVIPSQQGNHITFIQAPNHYYEVQYSSNLGGNVAWKPLNTVKNRPRSFQFETFRTIFDPEKSSDTRFYRVVITER